MVLGGAMVSAQTIPVTFESGVTLGTNWIGDNVTSVAIVNDPAPGGTNGQVGRIITNANAVPWQNAQLLLNTNYLDLTNATGSKIVTLSVYSTVAIDYLFKVEDPLNGGANTQTAASHNGSGWQTLTFDFNLPAQNGPVPNDQYKKLVFFPLFNKNANDFNAASVTTTFIDNLNGEVGAALNAPEPLALIEDFETGIVVGDNLIADNITSFTIVPDPAAGGINGNVGRIITNATTVPWQNAQLIMTANYLDLTGNNKTATLDVYSTVPVDYLMKVEQPLNGGVITQTAASHAGNGWQTLTFDFNFPAQNGPSPNDEYKKIVFFPLFNKVLNDFNGTPGNAGVTTTFIDKLRGALGTPIITLGAGTCITTSNVASEGSFSVGYKVVYETLPNGTDVKITYTLLDTDKQGLVAFLQRETPFAESNLNFVSGQTWTTTLTNQTPGAVISYRCKFAFAGGLANTLYIPYTVGTDCSATNDVTAQANFTASVGDVTFSSIQLLLNATDLSGLVVYTITYNGMTQTVSGQAGTPISLVLGALSAETVYSITVSASDLAGNVASNNPITLSATTGASTNTPCEGTDSEASEGSFEVGYTYELETNGTDVTMTFELLDNKVGVVAYLFRQTPFQETQMTLVPGTSKKFSSVVTNQTIGETIVYACKFAFAGGLAVTKYFEYVVGDDCALSNDLFETATFSVYPNPTSDVWTVKTNQTNVQSIALFDVSGKKVMSQQTNHQEVTIDGSNLMKGMYFIQIQTAQGVETIKVLKN
ncbi:MAG: T9SS type A sorting domain-containing protein [Flavobacterium sp.]